MKRFKNFAAPLAATLALAAGLTLAVPAQAQMRHHEDAWRMTPQRNAEIRQDINSLRNAIDRAEARRTISKREANGLRSQARDVQRLYGSYARNGLTRQEARAHQSRVNSVRVALRMERRDWDNRRN